MECELENSHAYVCKIGTVLNLILCVEKINFDKGYQLFIYAMRMLLSLEYTLYSINYCNGNFRGALIMPDNSLLLLYRRKW